MPRSHCDQLNSAEADALEPSKTASTAQLSHSLETQSSSLVIQAFSGDLLVIIDSSTAIVEARRATLRFKSGPWGGSPGTGAILKARHRYVALVEEVFRDREFHGVLGKEYIDGEVYYLVDWVPTLARGCVLHKFKAQPLINQFEASFEAQREKKRVGAHRLEGSGVTDGMQRKRQGRTRNML
ncbi:hypothetical protein BJ878DRAFT_556598 [Calycina marina]|uniref:Uncharacterized protein n=1 Tax=Calycina marina TaxID=1763456 RepID=A0A9P7YZB8_9HELO|nr:hypothetical protein BJ878DRAFT_556598 [Calycina marina]